MSISLIKRLIFRNEACLTLRLPFQQFYRKYTQPKTIVNMNECLISHPKDSEVFQVTFRFLSAECKLDKQIILNRQVNESISNLLERINLRIQKYLEKKQKRRKLEDEPRPAPETNTRVKLLRNNEKLDDSLLCETFIKDPKGLRLVVYDNEYEIRFNVPRVSKIKLPSSIMAGFPAYPAVFEAEHTRKKLSEFVWYRSNTLHQGKPNWEEIGTGYLYTPNVSDIGYRLKIVCYPKNEEATGPAIEVISKDVVQAGPGNCAFENRHTFTKDKLSGKSFRMVSYNILAETYADTSYSQEVLFPYCPKHALEMDYRKQLILKEVIGYNADIICFQEVDESVYKKDLAPALTMLNYDSNYNTKKDTREGLAIFFDQGRFERLAFENKIIGSDVDLEGFNSVWLQIENEKAKETFLKRSTAVQVTTLRSRENPSEILVVANTHLYFRPDADHIRLLQGYYALVYARSIADRVKNENTDCNVSLLICGDFNSTPESGVYQLMTENYVPPDFPGWLSCENQEIRNVPLKHDLNLSSACGTPEYTNYTPNFSGCLDYIYYETDHLAVEQIVPMPSKEEITAFEGLPSVTFPSDHIALCVDLKWLK